MIGLMNRSTRINLFNEVKPEVGTPFVGALLLEDGITKVPFWDDLDYYRVEADGIWNHSANSVLPPTWKISHWWLPPEVGVTYNINNSKPVVKEPF